MLSTFLYGPHNTDQCYPLGNTAPSFFFLTFFDFLFFGLYAKSMREMFFGPSEFHLYTFFGAAARFRIS